MNEGIIIKKDELIVNEAKNIKSVQSPVEPDLKTKQASFEILTLVLLGMR